MREEKYNEILKMLGKRVTELADVEQADPAQQLQQPTTGQEMVAETFKKYFYRNT